MFFYSELEKTLENQREENLILRTKLLEMKTEVHKCKCDKITPMKENCLNESKKCNPMKVPVTIETKSTSNSCNNKIWEIENDDCIVLAVSKLKLRNTISKN